MLTSHRSHELENVSLKRSKPSNQPHNNQTAEACTEVRQNPEAAGSLPGDGAELRWQLPDTHLHRRDGFLHDTDWSLGSGG